MKLSVAMIVKNEEATLDRCLKNLVDTDELVIIDTGSTDGTGEIALKYTYRYYTDEYIWQDDFAAARNYANSRCTGDWIFVTDADEFHDLDTIRKIKDYIDSAPADVSVVDVTIDYGNCKYLSPRLYRNDPSIQWKGACHNYLNTPSKGTIDVTIHGSYSPTHKKDPDRALRILKKYVEEHPDCHREMFYLAREYVYRKDYDNALKLYNNYVKRGIWGPEIAEAYLQMAKCHWERKQVTQARNMCLQAINLNADFKEALLFMAKMTGPINSSRWKEFARTAKNRQVLFVRDVGSPSRVLPILHQGHPGDGKCVYDNSVYFGNNVKIDTTESVTIGKKVILSGDIEIIRHEHDFGPDRTKVSRQSPLTIYDNVYVGSHVIILEGCKSIGEYAVIGAGSVVTKDIAPYTIVAGNPAREIRKINDEV